VHNVAKGAVIRMTMSLAVELSPLNIRVNTLSPGMIDTPAIRPLIEACGIPPFHEGFADPAQGRSRGHRRNGVSCVRTKPVTSYITGVNLPVDGGWTASGGLGQPDPDTTKIFAEAMAKIFTIPGGPIG
jgi:meso-butanediol dehydrogenase/(S,S)-butanediol dehydrogenase/diacetyl reductase